jgi:hypothetical protein
VEKTRFWRPLCRTAIVLAVFPVPAFAWGPLGHRIVAETAALLVQDDLPKTWGPIVARYRFELGAYAFLPDSLFRHVDGNGGETEAPTHYLYPDAADEATAGTVDRRVAQFLELATRQLREVRAPRGGYLRGASAEGDVKRIYASFVDLGVMAHYSGDAAMPLHATKNWNGFAQGAGGIHFYFENDCVDVFEPGLAVDVLASARKYRKRWLGAWDAANASPANLVIAVIRDSYAAVAKLSDLDRRAAVLELAPPGSKANAKRKPAKEGCVTLRPLLVERLAKGAVLTASLWERALPEGVDLSGAAELRFSDMEMNPPYVAP